VESMWKKPKYLVVETEALPDIFVKVVYAKHLLESGVTNNISLAAKMAGISRSAIYKYRDVVFPYVNEMTGKVTSIYVVFYDKPGRLSQLIQTLYECGGNILTINQNIPVDGMAAVSLSATIDETIGNDLDTINAIKSLDFVVEARMLSAH